MRPINFYWPQCPPSQSLWVQPSSVSTTSALQRVNYASGAIKEKPGRTKFIGCHALISIQMRRQPTRSGSRTRMRTRTGTNSLTATASQPDTPHRLPASASAPRSMGGPWRWINNKVTTTKNNRAGDGALPPGQRQSERRRWRRRRLSSSSSNSKTRKCTIIELTNHRTWQESQLELYVKCGLRAGPGLGPAGAPMNTNQVNWDSLNLCTYFPVFSTQQRSSSIHGQSDCRTWKYIQPLKLLAVISSCPQAEATPLAGWSKSATDKRRRR